MRIADLLKLLNEKSSVLLRYLEKNEKIDFMIFVFVILLAAFFRIYNLDGFPAWYIDEGTWATLGKNILQGNFREAPQATLSKYPFFAFLVGLSLLFKSDMFHARLIPAIFGIGSTIIIYVLGRKLYGRLAGVLAALSHSINRFAIYYERSVFLDVGVEFFILLSLLLLSENIKKPSNSKMLVLLALSVALGIMSKFVGISMVIAVALILLVFKQPKKKILVFTLCAILAPLAWYTGVFLSDPTDFTKEYLTRIESREYFGTNAARFAGALSFGFLNLSHFGAFFLVFGLISVFYLLLRFKKKHVFILIPVSLVVLFYAIMLSFADFYLASIIGLFSLASGKFLADVIQDTEGVRLFGLMTFTILTFLFSRLLPPEVVKISFLPILPLMFIALLLTLKMLKRLNNSLNITLTSLTKTLTLVLILCGGILISYDVYGVLSTDGRQFSTFGESSNDQKMVIDYVNSHAKAIDIIYAETVIIFQLRADARNNGFIDNVTVHEAKYVVVDPFWRIYDKNPFYGIDIGTPREWVVFHWILVKTFGQYAIYLNPKIPT